MQRLRNSFHIFAVACLVALIALPLSFQDLTQGIGAAVKEVRLPKGAQVYSIAQAAETWPRMTEARIDPVDVHVGDRQTIEVVVESRSPVDEVVAHIGTDNGEVDLPLEYVEDVASAKQAASLKLAVRESAGTPVANAQEQVTRARYRGTWTVRDTHNITYQTVIVARAGSDESSVTLSWSDACGIPLGGSYTIDSPCTISSPDGIDDGDAIISSSLTLDASFAFNEGRSFTITGSGSVAMCSNCSLQQTNIWQVDADGDGWPANSFMYLQNDAPPNGVRRTSLATMDLDCDDTNSRATNDCTSQFWLDSDGDGYYSVSAVGECPKSASCSERQGDDCYDQNADAYPGQGSYFTTDRGDGSFDYNCDGIAEQLNYGPGPGGWSCQWSPGGGPPGFCISSGLPGYTGNGSPGMCGAEAEVLDLCRDPDQDTWPNGHCDMYYTTVTESCH